ncbi:expressed protein, partial [Aureococcus anophagefferens]
PSLAPPRRAAAPVTLDDAPPLPPRARHHINCGGDRAGAAEGPRARPGRRPQHRGAPQGRGAGAPGRRVAGAGPGAARGPGPLRRGGDAGQGRRRGPRGGARGRRRELHGGARRRARGGGGPARVGPRREQRRRRRRRRRHAGLPLGAEREPPLRRGPLRALADRAREHGRVRRVGDRPGAVLRPGRRDEARQRQALGPAPRGALGRARRGGERHRGRGVRGARGHLPGQAPRRRQVAAPRRLRRQGAGPQRHVDGHAAGPGPRLLPGGDGRRRVRGRRARGAGDDDDDGGRGRRGLRGLPRRRPRRRRAGGARDDDGRAEEEEEGVARGAGRARGRQGPQEERDEGAQGRRRGRRQAPQGRRGGPARREPQAPRGPRRAGHVRGSRASVGARVAAAAPARARRRLDALPQRGPRAARRGAQGRAPRQAHEVRRGVGVGRGGRRRRRAPQRRGRGRRAPRGRRRRRLRRRRRRAPARAPRRGRGARGDHRRRRRRRRGLPLRDGQGAAPDGHDAPPLPRPLLGRDGAADDGDAGLGHHVRGLLRRPELARHQGPLGALARGQGRGLGRALRLRDGGRHRAHGRRQDQRAAHALQRARGLPQAPEQGRPGLPRPRRRRDGRAPHGVAGDLLRDLRVRAQPAGVPRGAGGAGGARAPGRLRAGHRRRPLRRHGVDVLHVVRLGEDPLPVRAHGRVLRRRLALRLRHRGAPGLLPGLRARHPPRRARERVHVLRHRVRQRRDPPPPRRGEAAQHDAARAGGRARRLPSDHGDHRRFDAHAHGRDAVLPHLRHRGPPGAQLPVGARGDADVPRVRRRRAHRAQLPGPGRRPGPPGLAALPRLRRGRPHRPQLPQRDRRHRGARGRPPQEGRRRGPALLQLRQDGPPQRRLRPPRGQHGLLQLRRDRPQVRGLPELGPRGAKRAALELK